MNQFYEQNAPWELIGKKLAGELTVEESQTLQEWIQEDAKHPKILEQAEFVWKTSGQIEKVYEKDIEIDAAWNKLSDQLAFKDIEGKVVNLSFWQRYRSAAVVAASILFVGILASYWMIPEFNAQQQQEIQWLLVDNELDGPKTVQMPDGSTIILNKNTSLQYPDKFDQRLVKLKGEAFFDVAHDPKKPFIVKFGVDEEQAVEVLGTSFNIRSYPKQNKTEVAVLTGKVRFETATKKQQLIKGQAAIYHRAEDQMNLVQRPNATSWKSKSFEFKNQSLNLIVEELSGHFNQKIELHNPALKNCVFKGKYEDADLNRILQEIAFGLELEVEEQDGIFYLSGEACE